MLMHSSNSINSRVCVKPWLKIPSSPCGQTTGNTTAEERRLVANKFLARPKSLEEEKKAWLSRGSKDTVCTCHAATNIVLILRVVLPHS